MIGVQVVGELKQRLRREIATVSLFEAPTVASLTRLLEPPADTEKAFEKTRGRVSRKKAALDRKRRSRPVRGRRNRS